MTYKNISATNIFNDMAFSVFDVYIAYNITIENVIVKNLYN